MMKLIKNECIKLWKQTSMKVLLIIIAVIIVALPLFSLAINKLDVFIAEYGAEELRDMSLEEAEYGDSIGQGYYAGEYRAEAEAYQFFIDIGESSSWKYDTYNEELLSLARQKYALEVMVRGTYDIFDTYEQGYAYVDLTEDKDSPLYGMKFITERENEDGYYENIYDTALWEQVSTDALSAYLAEVDEAYADLKTIVTEATADSYYEDMIEVEQATYDILTLSVEIDRTAAEKAPDDEISKYDYDVSVAELDMSELRLDILKFLRNEQISPDDWQYRMYANVLSSYANKYVLGVVMPEEVYREAEAEGMIYTYYETYDDYRTETEASRKNAEEVLTLAEYSILNDIPSSYLLESSAKQTLRNSLNSAISVISVMFLVVAAGTIVAQEYMTGTIRLLLIRPKTRHKILASKLFALLFYFGVLLGFAVAVQSVMSLCCFGVSDFFTPDLLYSNGTVVELPALLRTAQTVAYATLTAFFISSIAFLFSTLMHKSNFAITMALVVLFLSSTVQQIAMALSTGFSFIGYTVLPYLDLTVFLSTPFDFACASMGADFSSILNLINTSMSSLTNDLYPWLGVVQLALVTALCIFFSFFAFKKQQVKS